jgi:hypothetical protein
MKIQLCKSEFIFELLPAIAICRFTGDRITTIAFSWFNYAIQLRF